MRGEFLAEKLATQRFGTAELRHIMLELAKKLGAIEERKADFARQVHVDAALFLAFLTHIGQVERWKIVQQLHRTDGRSSRHCRPFPAWKKSETAAVGLFLYWA